MAGDSLERSRAQQIEYFKGLARKDYNQFITAFEALPPEERLALMNDVLNNFYTRAPGGYSRSEASEDPDADTTETELDRGKKPVRMSELRFGQSLHQFEAAFDAAVVQCGLKPDEIAEENRTTQATMPNKLPMDMAGLQAVAPQVRRAEEMRRNLHATLFPIYKALRAMGYSHDDVT